MAGKFDGLVKEYEEVYEKVNGRKAKVVAKGAWFRVVPEGSKLEVQFLSTAFRKGDIGKMLDHLKSQLPE